MSYSLRDALPDVERITNEIVAPRAAAIDESAAFPEEAVTALGHAGLLGLVTPAEHGGLGLGIDAAAAVVERVARDCGTTAMVLCMHYCGAAVLAGLGPPEVNRAIARGKHLSTLAFSETGSRSHFWSPVSTARRDGDAVVLDAEKSWVTSARHATAYVWSSRPVVADAASTLWLVPADAPGLSVPTPFNGMGLRGNDSAPIRAEGVRVPLAARLGGDGEGLRWMTGTVLPWFAVLNSACGLGLAETAVARTADHVTGNGFAYSGGTLRDLATVRAYLARMRVHTDTARALWLDTVAALVADRPDARLRVLEVKAAVSEAAQQVTTLAMRVCGGAAFRREVGLDRVFRDAQAMGVMAPTTDVLYDFIGKVMTGLDPY